MNVLYISMMMPQKNAANAGAKTLYYYISNLAKEENITVKLIAKATNNEECNTVIENVEIFPVKNSDANYNNPINIIKDANAKLNPYHKFGNTLRETLYDNIYRTICRIKEEPNIVIFEFSQMLYLIKKIRRLFPNAKIVASEHDVTFLWHERNLNNANGIVKKTYLRSLYNKMRRDELEALSVCDLILPHNMKDERLLLDAGIVSDKLHTIVPYYDEMSMIRNPDGKTVIFYGAMNRSENYEAAIWFVKNVMPKIEDKGIHFHVIGGNPNEVLRNVESLHVHIDGFVSDLTKIFSKCICMVAPLKLGAGIKVKVLETMACGIPVLTNKIGIEGIPAINKKSYLHCESPEDYANAILYLQSNPLELLNIGEKERDLIVKNFNKAESLEKYKEHLLCLAR